MQMPKKAPEVGKRGEFAIFVQTKIALKRSLPGTPIVPGGGFDAVHKWMPENRLSEALGGIFFAPVGREFRRNHFLATGTLTQPEVLSVNSRQLKQ